MSNYSNSCDETMENRTPSHAEFNITWQVNDINQEDIGGLVILQLGFRITLQTAVRSNLRQFHFHDKFLAFRQYFECFA